LLARLGRDGLVGAQGFRESSAGAFAALLIAVAWYGGGDLLLRLVAGAGPAEDGASASLALARRCALGAGLWSHVWLALGLVGLYRPAAAVVALAIGLALAGLAFWRSRPSVHRRPTQGRGDLFARLALASVVLPVAFAAVAALAPPTAKDTLQYHIALPKAWLAVGALVDVPYTIPGLRALGAEMSGIWGMLLGRLVSFRAGEAAFGATMFTYFPMLLAVVHGWARERGLGRGPALTAAAIVASAPVAWEVAGAGYVDLALALYTVLAFRAAARWWTGGHVGALVELALALGFALSVKLLAAAALFFLAALVLFNARRVEGQLDGTASRRAAGGLAALAAGLLIGSPWYLRTWLLTGSPLFPFSTGLWPGHALGWDETRSVLFQAFNAQYGGDPKGPLDYVLLPLRLALMGRRDVPAEWESVLGPAFLAGAPLVALALWRRRLDTEFCIAASGAAWLFAWWALSAQVLRYLLPALALGALAIAGSTAAPAHGGRVLARALLTATLGGQLVILAWFVRDDPLRVILGTEPRQEYLTRRLDYYPYYRLIDETLPTDARVWLIDVRRDTYHLERPYFGDYLFEDYTLRQWVVEARSAAELRARARTAGVTHVLVRHDLLFDPARSVLVDGSRPEAENRARLALAHAFLVDEARVLRVDQKFLLTALP
jgi:hypothetical protein